LHPLGLAIAAYLNRRDLLYAGRQREIKRESITKIERDARARLSLQAKLARGHGVWSTNGELSEYISSAAVGTPDFLKASGGVACGDRDFSERRARRIANKATDVALGCLGMGRSARQEHKSNGQRGKR
jgi:hypothetical protein